MKTGIDITKKAPGIFLIHHNLPGKKVNMKNEFVHHLIIPISGEISVKTKNKDFKLGPGKMVYIPCGEPHEFSSSQKGSGERIVCIIDQTLWKKLKIKSFGETVLNLSHLLKELIIYILLNEEINHIKELTSTIVYILSDQLENQIDWGSELDSLSAKLTDQRILHAVEYLEANFKNNLNMADLSKECGMSLRNLTRLFLQQVGMNPKQFLIRLRLNYAKTKLQERKTNVTEIAYEVGYSSLSQFIRSFQKNFGKLPSDYL